MISSAPVLATDLGFVRGQMQPLKPKQAERSRRSQAQDAARGHACFFWARPAPRFSYVSRLGHGPNLSEGSNRTWMCGSCPPTF